MMKLTIPAPHSSKVPTGAGPSWAMEVFNGMRVEVLIEIDLELKKILVLPPKLRGFSERFSNAQERICEGTVAEQIKRLKLLLLAPCQVQLHQYTGYPVFCPCAREA